MPNFDSDGVKRIARTVVAEEARQKNRPQQKRNTRGYPQSPVLIHGKLSATLDAKSGDTAASGIMDVWAMSSGGAFTDIGEQVRVFNITDQEVLADRLLCAAWDQWSDQYIVIVESC